MSTSEQKAYDAIRLGISSGVYRSGSHLRAGELAADLGVSRTPVREALRRLHAEGHVTFFANRGAFVSGLSREDVDELFDLRVVLESHAAELATLRISEDQIGQLRGWTDEMECCASAKVRDSAGLARANDSFHGAIIGAAAGRRLAIMMGSIAELSWVTRTFSVYSDADLAASISHHREIIRAFSGRDPIWAGAVMRSHIRAAYHVFASSLEAQSTVDAIDGSTEPGERPFPNRSNG